MPIVATSPIVRRLALLLACVLVLTACGGGDAADDDPAESAADAEGTEEAAADTEPAPDGTDGEATFPVEIDHAFGTTTISEPPQRVVTWGWGSTDAAIALGVVPVAVPFDAYAGDEEGRLPWAVEAVEAMGAALPEVLPAATADEVPFEAIAAAEPDVILAHYSGITESDYELLSAIAPTVAYPDAPWTTPWRDVVQIAGEALGRADEAEEILAEIDETVADAAEAHPELEGLTVANVVDAAGTFYVYKEADPRVGFMTDLGLEVAESVATLADGAETFFYTLSYERLADLTSDILVVYTATEADETAFLTDGPTADMAQVQEGRVALVRGPALVSSVSPPTALSLTWGLDEYVAALSAAASGEGVAADDGAADAPAEEAAAVTFEDPDAQAAADAWALVFDSAADIEAKSAHLEDPAEVADTLAAYAETGESFGGITLAATDVAVDGEAATITYDILFGGSSAYGDQTGQIDRVDGTWTVSTATFCQFMATARTPCA